MTLAPVPCPWAWRLRDVRALLEQRPRELQTHLSFAQSHPLIRNLAEHGLFIQTKSNDA